MAFDIEMFLRFRPAQSWCQKCYALWKEPYRECNIDTERKFASCRNCGVKYLPTEEFPLPSGLSNYLASIFPQPLASVKDLAAHSTNIARISTSFRRRQKYYPPFRSLLKAFINARSFIHFVSYGISPMMIGILKLTAQYVPVRGIVSGNIGENTLSEVTDYQDEAPDLTLHFWKHSDFRAIDEPHHKLIVIDGLMAFKGSSNLTQTAWRSALNDMDMIEVVTDIDEVISLHNRYFSPLWGKVSAVEDEIPMERDNVPF